MRLLYGYTMSDELEHSATLRARAACLREHRLHFILCFGAFLAGATGSLLTASFLKANVAAPNGTLLAEGLAMLGVIGLGGLLSALFRCLSSRHSRLGKSVLSQYPAESVDPKAVFQEIDADILQHGKRFGGLSIGKEWAIFQEAMLISRIRGIFSDILEPEREHGETAYLLCLVDADGSILEASLPSRSVLDKARACLLESVPDAVSGGFEAMTDFMNMDDEGRREINRRVNARRQAGKPVSFSYAGPDGVPTSLATEQTVEEGITRIKPGDMLVLTPLSPLFLPSGEECLYIACEQDAGQTETLRLSAYIRRGDDYLRVFREMPGREAGLLFRDCFMRRAVPDITDWHVQSWENDWPEERPILFVDDKRFENTSFEDVEAALDGVDGGDYGSFFLMFPGGYDGYLSLNGRQGNNYVVEAALPDEDRYFRIATPRRAQVLFWFSGYYEKSRLPYMEEWKDVTKEVKKRRGEAD